MEFLASLSCKASKRSFLATGGRGGVFFGVVFLPKPPNADFLATGGGGGGGVFGVAFLNPVPKPPNADFLAVGGGGGGGGVELLS